MHVYENKKIFSVFELIDDLCDNCFKVEHFSQSMVGRFTKRILDANTQMVKYFMGQMGSPLSRASCNMFRYPLSII